MAHQHESILNDWNAQYKLVKKISNYGGMEKYTKTIPIEKAFYLNDRTLRCIDERTFGGVHSAGSLILLSKEEIREYQKKANGSEATSHKLCGAALLAYLKEHGLPADSIIPQEVIDTYADTKAREVAKDLGIPYKGQLEVSPTGHHIAVVVYYTAADFDPSNVKELPAGFVINRNYTPKNAALKELDIALSIAFGAHGFGNLFTDKTPFYVIAIGKNGTMSVEDLKAEARDIVEKYGKRVVLDGFAAANKTQRTK